MPKCRVSCPALNSYHPQVKEYERKMERWILRELPAYCHVAECLVFPYRRKPDECAADATSKETFKTIAEIREDLENNLESLVELEKALSAKAEGVEEDA